MALVLVVNLVLVVVCTDKTSTLPLSHPERNYATLSTISTALRGRATPTRTTMAMPTSICTVGSQTIVVRRLLAVVMILVSTLAGTCASGSTVVGTVILQLLAGIGCATGSETWIEMR